MKKKYKLIDVHAKLSDLELSKEMRSMALKIEESGLFSGDAEDIVVLLAAGAGRLIRLDPNVIMEANQ